MAITESLLHASRSTFRLRGMHDHILTYLVDSDTPIQTAQVYPACTASTLTNPVPRLYSIYAQDNGAYCSEIAIQSRNQDHRNFQVEVTLAPLPEGHSVDDDELNPLLFAKRFRVDFESVTEEATQDGAGTKIENPAKRPLLDPIFQTRFFPVLVVTGEVGTVDDVIALQQYFDNTVNSSPFGAYDTGQAKAFPPRSSDLKTTYGIDHYTVTIRVGLRTDGWKHKRIGEGDGYLLTAGGKFVGADDGDGQKTGGRVFLKTDGTLAADASEAAEQEFGLEREVDYSPLLAPFGFPGI